MNILRLLVWVSLLYSANIYAQTDSIYLWPRAVPGEAKHKSGPVPTTLEDGTIRIIEVTDPFLAVFPPKNSNKNGRAIIVCPGGAYVRLAVNKEGYTVANWLTDLGYTVFVLHYRVPDKRDGALQDLQRSLRVIRSMSRQYELDPKKIGAMGFSAGAHMVARAGMATSPLHYPDQDHSDSQSGTPDCMIIIYPAYLDDGPNHSLSPDLVATSKTANTFIFQTMDDESAQSSFALASALQRAKANVELHMLPSGGHGYGMNAGNKAAETWPNLLKGWLELHF